MLPESLQLEHRAAEVGVVEGQALEPGRDVGTGDADGLAWWPAWALIEGPAPPAVLETAQTGAMPIPQPARRLMVELLRLYRQGRRREAVTCAP